MGGGAIEKGRAERLRSDPDDQASAMLAGDGWLGWRLGEGRRSKVGGRWGGAVNFGGSPRSHLPPPSPSCPGDLWPRLPVAACPDFSVARY